MLASSCPRFIDFLIGHGRLNQALSTEHLPLACAVDQETWLFLGLSAINACLGRTYAVPVSATETGWQPINASNGVIIAGWMDGTRTRYVLQVGLCFSQANHVSSNMI